MPTNKNDENQQLLNLIGDDAFTRLCMVFGGTRIYVSNSARCRHRLNVIVGESMAEKIIETFHGESILLPKLSSLEIKKRNAAIIEDSKQGISHRGIAMKYDLTDRQVRRIINES